MDYRAGALIASDRRKQALESEYAIKLKESRSYRRTGSHRLAPDTFAANGVSRLRDRYAG